MASQYDFTVTLHDLAFILKQIKISEAATNPDGSVNAEMLRELVSSPLLPYGLRTVDGSWNNLYQVRNYTALPIRQCRD
jgi:hypothetical protein